MDNKDNPTALFWGRQRIGDVVMSIPALKIIRRHAPDLNVRYITTFYAGELIRLTGLVDDVRCVRHKGGLRNVFRWWKLRREVRRGEYQHIFLTGKISRYERKIGDPPATTIRDFPQGHTAERCARTVMAGLGIEEVPIPSTEVEIPDRPEITNKFLSFGISPEDTYLVVHSGCNRVLRKRPGEAGSEKLWHPHKYGPLFDRLKHARPDLEILLVGTESERDWITEHIVDNLPPLINPHNLAGHTTIPETIQLLRHASCLLCCDSGVMHLGTMTATPMVALFGPTDENETGPFGAADRALTIRAVPLEEAREDPECMEQISVDEVFEGIQQQLKRFGPSSSPG